MSTSSNQSAVFYTERLLPTPWLYLITFLIVPAVILLLLPVNLLLAIFLAPTVYLLVITILIMTSPKIMVSQDTFYAGTAYIPLSYLGTVTILNRDELSIALGVQADARAFLIIRGWIHTALKVTNTDPTDPAPYWIVTTRRPQELAAALNRAAQLADNS
ncbi:DUF3093 family protein [Canibacter sp. lx-72]|uniref:DUF3093 domain-containing protein n=1 Tax=Canibacter zhuwentaonis TaxID=2837491 RepID=UPI001BDDA618|nr:DUF3093 family protein [Canibacter zhuwentaonis]MBT1035138.1 DUF3093 family protein [Canibacter zhuwentaonis]